MKKLILLFALALMMCGCKQPANNLEVPLGGSILTTAFQTIIIDSYITITGNRILSHKGNCKYCTERRKKEQEELIRRLKED